MAARIVTHDVRIIATKTMFSHVTSLRSFDSDVDNSSAIAAGRIPWADIRGFEVQTVQNQRFLTIEVYDPEKYVQRARFLKRAFVALNAGRFGGPIQISAHALKIGFDQLVTTLTQAHEKHRATAVR
jgi:hypothetical protein